MRKLIFVWACLLLAIPCVAEVIIVDPNGSADFDNIQDAIDHSWDGDIIKANPGTYTENIYFNGAAVTITSTNPNDTNIVESTIIAASSGYSVNFDFLEGSESVITGFTITGGGIYCNGSSPTITKNVIRDCSISNGRGIRGENGSAPSISYNTIKSNTSGGIISCSGLISDNDILDNFGTGLISCAGTVKNNIISGNSAGMNHCHGAISNNLISGSRDEGLGRCDGIISNNMIIGNGDSGLVDCNAITKNNIIACNKGYGISGLCQNSFNDIWNNESGNFGGGASAGTGDIVRNPLFTVDGYWDYGTWVDGDYHVLSEAGRWDSNSQSWILDDWTSHCIDAGDPNDSIGYEPNPNGGRINIGAYGGTAQASKSTSGIVEPVCTHYPTMDYNKDCKVDFKDFAMLAQTWLDCNLDPPEACWE